MSAPIEAASEPRNRYSDASDDLVEMALAVAERWPVFPCGADKKPLRGSRGFKDATRDPAAIRKAFRDPRAKLIAVPTGAASGADCLDFDPRHGSNEWRRANIHRLPETRVDETPGLPEAPEDPAMPGEHWLLQHADGVRNQAGEIAPGIDIRGDGGYMIVPPSAGYTIISDVEIAPWPDWLLPLALKPQKPPPRPAFTPERATGLLDRRYQGFILKLLDNVRAAPEGAKHDVLLRQARTLGGVMHAAGITENDAVGHLLAALPNTVRNWQGAAKTALDGLRHGALRPIDLEDRPRPGYRGNGHKPPLPGDPRDDPPPDADPGAELPTIQYSAGKLVVLTDAAENSLIQAGADIYQRAESLVRPGFIEVSAADNRTTKAAGLYPLDHSALLEELQRVAVWERYDARSDDWVTINPPNLIARVLAARKGKWKIRSVLGVITAPTLRPDGSVIDTPGYDPSTRLYYAPDPGLKIPPIAASPTKDDAVAALRLFADLLEEFPFVAEQDRAVGLSLPISAVVRGAFSMAPVHAFSAPTPGSGKSYLADLTSTIISGRWCPVIAPGPSEEELEKRLGAMVLAGHPIISLDNCSTELSGDALCQVSERPLVRIRILGKSEAPECEFRGILIANGNNLVVSGDMVRRVLLGMLDSGLERPEDRQFGGNPVAKILKDRGRYIAAAITIVRAYLAAGLPGKLKPLASYAEWSDLVRSPLVWLGCADPVDTMRAIRAADPVLTTLSIVLSHWTAAFGADGKTAAEVAKAYQSYNPKTPEGQAMDELRPTLAAVAANRGGVIDAVRLGYWLRRQKGRPAGGLKFDSTTAHGGGQRWFSARSE
jgi:hypothetical protein